MLGNTPQDTVIRDDLQITAIREEPLVIGLLGPWGAGKTTLMNRIAADYAPAPDRLGIIFAEFGEVNVDAARIRSGQVVEVKDRCICCHGADALERGIQSLRDKVDLILVETSGVSNGNNVRAVFEAMGLKFSILGLVNSAAFAPDDTEVLDTQLPAVDRVILTHQDWLGPAPTVTDPRLEELNAYVKRVAEESPIDFASDNFGLRRDTFDDVVRRANPPTFFSPGQIFTRVRQTRETQHHQVILTLVLHENCSAEDLERCLRDNSDLIKRAKGVIQVDGIRREFDFVPGRSEDDSSKRTMRFSLGEESGSALFGKRDHVVLCSLDPKGSLLFDKFIQIGLPDISDHKIARTIDRYPSHMDIYAAGKGFPVYHKEGDRFYGILYPIRERYDQLPSDDAKSALLSAWKKTLDAYLDWRASGLEALAELPEFDSKQYARNLISLNVLWHMLNMPDDISTELSEKLKSLKPATQFFESCLQLSEPPESGQSTELTDETALMIRDFIRYAKENENAPTELIRKALEHAVVVDKSGTWQKGLEKLLME